MEIIQQLSIETLSMISGKLLGDANISIEKDRHPRFRFAHCASDKAWCFYCYEQLNKYLPLSKPRYRKIIDNRIKNGFTEQYYTQSFKSRVVFQLKELWYPNNRKTIPFEFLAYSFTPICLAWWYQDDGHLKIENNQVKKVILSTDGFTKAENETLIRFITKSCTCTCHESMLAVSSRTRNAKRWIFLYPYPRRFISLILLFVPSIFPFE